MVFLCKKMTRTKVKGTKFKAASSPDQEPDFYSMPPLVPNVTSDEDMSHDSGEQPSSQGYEQRPQYYEQPLQPLVPAASSSSYEPLPYDYQPRFAASNFACDRVLDEAVEELFMDMPHDGTTGNDPLDDFVQDWVPADAGFAQTLDNDAALGFMLEKLLEE